MQITLNRKRVETLIRSFAGQRIIVLGDVMLDRFVWGKVRRISPEAPVPVVDIIEETNVLGGSANVAANIKALGGIPLPLGVVGSDEAAFVIFELMRGSGIDHSSLLREDRPTTVKTRIIAQNQQIVRTDRESRSPLSNASNERFADVFASALDSAGAIIISDYNKGVINGDLLRQILPLARRAGVPVFLDPKSDHAECYRSITLIKPNHHEAELLTGIAIEDEARLEKAGRLLLEKFECEYALITRGEQGMSLFGGDGVIHLPTSQQDVLRRPFDKTGAGDTVMAALALANAAGASMEESAVLANHAAGLVVGKVGTASITADELLSEF